jgi:hypothetical protein
VDAEVVEDETLYCLLKSIDVDEGEHEDDVGAVGELDEP